MKRILIVFFSLALLMLVESCEKITVDGRMRFQISTNRTKSSITETSDIQVEGNSFVLDAWLESANRGVAFPSDNINPHYISNAKVTLGPSGWAGTDLYWRNVVWTNFWAAYPETATGRGDFIWQSTPSKISDDQEKTPSFTYDMTSYTASSAAAITTPDILIGYARGKWNEDEQSGGVIKFDLQHVTSAISFTIEYVDAGCSIDDVTLAGVHYKGTCTLTGVTTESLKDSASVVWTFDDTPSVGVGFKCEGSNISADKYFFLIPQQLDSPAVLKASINNKGASETKEVTLSGYNWKPGYRYTYKLSFYADKDEFTVTTTEYNATTGEWID